MRTRMFLGLVFVVACGDDSDPQGGGGSGAGEATTSVGVTTTGAVTSSGTSTASSTTGSAGGGGGAGGGVECDSATPDGFAVCYADAYCAAAFVDCGCSEQDWQTEAECHDFFLDVWTDIITEMEAAGATYNPACADAMVAAIDCSTREELQVIACPGCTVFHGSLPEGSRCSEDLPECANGLQCDGGVCVSACPLAQGAPCTDTDQCEAFLACEQGTCTAAPSAPSPCADGVCAAGSWCAPNDLCAPVKPEGAPCDWHDECDSLECHGDVCVAAFPLICEEP